MSTTVASSQRFTKDRPCPRCGGHPQLPQGRAPTLSDWQQISRRMRFEIDQRINLLTRTRNQLDQCIGCGCLSLQKCQLYNKDDRMGAKGSGPRAILG